MERWKTIVLCALFTLTFLGVLSQPDALGWPHVVRALFAASLTVTIIVVLWLAWHWYVDFLTTLFTKIRARRDK